MAGVFMLRSPRFLGCVGLLLACTALATARDEVHKSAGHSRAEHANALAVKLVQLDREARLAFNKEHPGTLPDLHLVRPKPTVASFDWCNLNKVSDHHRQRTGDCWANAAVEALECSHLIRNNRRLPLSVQPILDHLRLGAEHMAGSSSIACDFLLKHGTASLADYPYTGKPAKPADVATPYRAIAWGYVSPDGTPPLRAQLKEHLVEHGPLAISVFATKKFHAYTGGLFSEPDATADDHNKTNHVVLLVGWDDTHGKHGAWKIKNTWGASWGEQGFMWIAYGSNNICHSAYWVRAASTFYRVPTDAFHNLVPDAKALPVWKSPQPAKPAVKSPATPAGKAK